MISFYSLDYIIILLKNGYAWFFFFELRVYMSSLRLNDVKGIQYNGTQLD